MSGRTKVYTNQCKVCTKCVSHPEYDNNLEPITKMCVWGNSKRKKELVEPKGKMVDCKLIGKGGV
jgi:hypothetical protein